MLENLNIGRGLFRTTTFRLLAFLTLVLAPIGLIAVFQTQALKVQLRQQAEATRLANLIEAVGEERQVIDRAVGAAEAMGVLTQGLDPTGAECRDRMASFISAASPFAFAGLLPRDGQVTCSNRTGIIDLSDTEELDIFFEQGRIWADASAVMAAEEQGVLAVGVPVLDDVGLDHFSTIWIRQSELLPDLADDAQSLGKSSILVLFNDQGDLLASRGDIERASMYLPANASLTSLASNEPLIFRRDSQNGVAHVFGVVPLFDDVVYAMVGWPAASFWDGDATQVPVWLFPVLMWLVTLAVAYIAINRLVLRHTRLLGLRMRRFALNRRLPDLAPGGDQPTEFSEMDRNFRHMAESIVRDEAQLENALREKNVLLREVHHRVKNNLQLIASIMNMQIRKSRASETGAVVRRLQDRVLSLAAVHQKIYQAETLSRIKVPELLSDILNKTLILGLPTGTRISTEAEFDHIELHPDQAVPLALLLAEASTNAVKYMGVPDGSDGFAHASLKRNDDDTVTFAFCNSKGVPINPDQVPGTSTTLGTQLIRAFCTQLGGQLEVTETDDAYKLEVRFTPQIYVDDA